MTTETRSVWATTLDGAHVEQGVIVHEGQEFTAGGAFVSPIHAAGYPKDGKLLAWDGTVLGTCRVVKSWPVRSYIGSRMCQIEATIDGRIYTGRGFGDGMLWRGKRKAGA